MNIREAVQAVGKAPDELSGTRIISIDIFRGLTVLVMVFVDNLDFVKKLPWWTYHMPLGTNGMTYVDMVFPAFLFVMGMSIPLAVDRRMNGGDSRGRIFLHILGRSLSLVALGLFIANAPQLDPQQSGMSAVSWTLLAFIGIALFWGNSAFSAANRLLSQVSKYSGLFLLAVLAIVFRRITPEGHVSWLNFSDWEILGLLGWSYLLVGSLYLLFKKNVFLLGTSLVVLVSLNVVSIKGWLEGLNRFPSFLHPFEAGLASITMAGLLASLIFLEGTRLRSFQDKALWAFVYAVVLAVAGWILSPLGISKLRDTPAWCLYCAGTNTLLFLILYWIADIKRWTGWAELLRIVGCNALLAYMLAYVAYLTPALFRLTADGTEGWYGVIRSLLFAAFILALTILLSRFKFRLQV